MNRKREKSAETSRSSSPAHIHSSLRHDTHQQRTRALQLVAARVSVSVLAARAMHEPMTHTRLSLDTHFLFSLELVTVSVGVLAARALDDDASSVVSAVD